MQCSAGGVFNNNNNINNNNNNSSNNNNSEVLLGTIIHRPDAPKQAEKTIITTQFRHTINTLIFIYECICSVCVCVCVCV